MQICITSTALRGSNDMDAGELRRQDRVKVAKPQPLAEARRP